MVHWVGIVKGRMGGWLERKDIFDILKFIYLYNQFYMILWVLRLNWVGCFIDSLSNKRAMCP